MKLMRALVLVLFLTNACDAGPALRVGVTLHAYYSWVASIVAGTPVEVVPVLSAAADSHGYQATPDDIKRMSGLDALVVNGLGHDDFVKPMIAASGNAKLVTIDPHTGVALIPYAGGGASNPHTFLSLTNAIQQVFTIEGRLSALDPEHSAAFKKNADAYVKKLRRLKADALGKLAAAPIKQVATVHDGYGYLMQELGLEVVTVIEPTHGVEPSAAELAKTIDAIRAAHVSVVFSELSFSAKLVDVIRKESGASVYTIDHMSTGEYSAAQFETAMKSNLDTIVRALTATGK